VLFAAPAEHELVWNESGINGTEKFLQRIWRFVWKWKSRIESQESRVENLEFSAEAKKLRSKTHQTIQKIEENFESLQFNTPVASLMELSNAIHDFKVEPETATESDVYAIREAVEALVLMLAPFAPHTAEDLFAKLVGNENGILANGGRFPIYNADLAKAEEMEIPVQVNGKLRAKIIVAAEADNKTLETTALADEKVREWTNGKEIVKIVVVPKRLVNIVIKG
jgi:leucyl-tRNA synthetase